jgi:hypothetical protein
MPLFLFGQETPEILYVSPFIQHKKATGMSIKKIHAIIGNT